MTVDRETYREQAREGNSVSAWAIRHCGGLYFAGFPDSRKPGVPKVKWVSALADARLFNASALSQAEKYIERIKQKDSLYVGMKAVKVSLGSSAADAPAPRSASGWIPVSERLPVMGPNHDGEHVAIRISDPSCAIFDWVTTGYLHSGKDWWSGRPGNYDSLAGWTVTHWARLPRVTAESRSQ